MSGSGTPPNRLTEELLNKLRAAISPLGARQRSVDFRLESHLTVYSADFQPPALHPVILRTHRASIQEGLSKHAFRTVLTSQSPLVLYDGQTKGAQSCRWPTVACHEPVFHDFQIPVLSVRLDELEQQRTVRLPITRYTPRRGYWSVPKFSRPAIRQIPPIRFQQPKSARYSSVIRARSKPAPKALMGLPIVKTPIPMHRFSLRIKEYFRKTMAEKAKTRISNVLISRVYDRITMGIFQSISQDERGTLLCYPKVEMTGRVRSLRNAALENSFLVLGQALDTKQSISVLVPANSLPPENLSKEGGPS